MLDHRPDVLGERLPGEEIDHGWAARRLLELVEIISRGIRAKALEDRDVAAQARFVYGAHPHVILVVLAVVSSRASPVAEGERGGMRVRSGPEAQLHALFVFLGDVV